MVVVVVVVAMVVVVVVVAMVVVAVTGDRHFTASCRAVVNLSFRLFIF